MTSRHTTPLLAMEKGSGAISSRRSSDRAYRLVFGAIGWPWLLFSLWGGTKADRRRLLTRVGLRSASLPHLGSWKADTGFLHRIVDAVEELRPKHVVELGAGASTLVCAKALERNGGGQLHSYDQNPDFVMAVREWLEEEGASARIESAPLRAGVTDWPGAWYALSDVPETIDLLIIDGPPWAVHPYVRGAAESLFDRLSPGAIVLLDDGARPGERIVAHRWRRNWPQIAFERVAGSTKGTLIGRRLREAAVIPLRSAKPVSAHGGWRRAAMIGLVFAAGWFMGDAIGTSVPANAASFIEEADASYAATRARHSMASQIESPLLDRAEITTVTGIALPTLPASWKLQDAQVYPSDLGTAVSLVMTTGKGETVSLFAARAETPAEKLPLLEIREGRSLAYWERGPIAFALTGDMTSERLLGLAALLAPK